MGQRGRPKIIYHPITENGEFGMVQELFSHVVMLPISKTGAHNGDTVWSIVEANKVVSDFISQGFKLINVISFGSNPDPDVYIVGWFLAKQ